MKGFVRYGMIGLACLLVMMTQVACSTIDDDLSDCPPEGNDYEMVYELQLVTDITMELRAQLTTQTEQQVADALYNHLTNVFTAYAQDIDLSFYDVDEERELLHHESHDMNDDEKSYELYLPKHQYRHLALANLEDNSWVKKEGGEQSSTLTLQQKKAETVESHETGLFTARTDMDVKEGEDQTFHVNLFMANSAAALVIDPRGQQVKKVEVFSTGFATGFNVNDSTYTFAEKDPLVRTKSVATGTDQLCFCSVNFPSRTKAEGDKALWEFRVYVTLDDGSVTETVLSVYEPLKPGELKIVKAYLDEDGVAHPTDSKVGVSVTLDWSDGGHYEQEL